MVSCFIGKPLLAVIRAKLGQADGSDVKQQIKASSRI